MKRKYYLRGLGFGILITTLVFVLIGGKEPSEAEIIKRAEELGYVKADISPTPMFDLDTLKEQLTITPELTPESQLTQTPELTPEGELTQTPKLTPEPTPIPTPKPTEPPTEGEDGAVTAVVEVEKGMTSTQVCHLLEDAGIVEDWAAFNNYMIERKLTDSINIGKFTLSSTMDWKEIARILTGK